MSSCQMHALANPAFETTLLVRDTCLCLHAQRAARRLARVNRQVTVRSLPGGHCFMQEDPGTAAAAVLGFLR